VIENQLSASTSSSGGAAPADRSCRYTKADGKPCRDWAVRGQDYCHRHDIFLHARPERPIDVPLLEDEASIVLLLSETLRAMAWGTIPVPNGRMLLAGCRLAHTIQMQRLEMAKFRMRVRRMGVREEDVFNPPSPELQLERAPQPDAVAAENAGSENEPLTAPLQKPNPRCRFRDLKKNWDKELRRTGRDAEDMFFPRHDETREEFNAAHALPFDHLEAIDREVAKARAMAAAAATENAAMVSLP
jgi:hypothetical protein